MLGKTVGGAAHTEVVVNPTALMITTTELRSVGPFDLGEVAMMGFGHRDERSFDGVMRMAFCLDGDYERQIGVEARQREDQIELRVQSIDDPLNDAEVEALRKQVARVVSLDHDGEAFHRLCLADPVLARVHQRAPGFRPAFLLTVRGCTLVDHQRTPSTQSGNHAASQDLGAIWKQLRVSGYTDAVRTDSQRSARDRVGPGTAGRPDHAPARGGACRSARPTRCGALASDVPRRGGERAAETARNRPVLQFLDRDPRLWSCGRAHARRAAIEGGGPDRVRD